MAISQHKKMGLDLFSFESNSVCNKTDIDLFHACTMRQNLEPYKTGDKIQCISIDFFGGVMTFYAFENGTRIVMDEFEFEYKFWRKM